MGRTLALTLTLTVSLGDYKRLAIAWVTMPDELEVSTASSSAEYSPRAEVLHDCTVTTTATQLATSSWVAVVLVVVQS